MNFPIVELNRHVVDWINRVPELRELIREEISYGDLDATLSFDPDWDYLQRKGCVERQEDEDKIYLFQPFCQYLWSLGLYMSVFFDTRIHAPLQVSLGLRSPDDILSEDGVEFCKDIYIKARLLHSIPYSEMLIDSFPKLNPPTAYIEAIGRANAIYCAGIAFIYAHEFAHHYLGHTKVQNSYSTSVEDELAADNLALDWIKDTFESNEGTTYQTGIMTVMAALLLSSADSVSGGGTHPDLDIRIRNAMAYFELPDPHYLWGYLALAIKFWLITYGELTMNEDNILMSYGFDSYKSMFDIYLDQLEIARKRLFPKELPRDWQV